MKKLNKIVICLMAVLLCVSLAACSKEKKTVTYADGVYTGRSSDYDEDESGNGSGYGVVEIEISDGKIVSCTFKMYELDGTLKDETYGADLSKENRLKAQKAVQSAGKYAAALVSSQDPDDVDVISGATISYHEFVEAVKAALDKAAQ